MDQSDTNKDGIINFHTCIILFLSSFIIYLGFIDYDEFKRYVVQRHIHIESAFDSLDQDGNFRSSFILYIYPIITKAYSFL